MDELRLALQHLRQLKCENGNVGTLNFVPEPDLVKLITYDTVMRAFEDPAFELKRHQYEPLATEVIESGARKLFSILVELRIEKVLKRCLEKNITDATLPILEEQRLQSLVPESATHFGKLQWEYFPLKLREYSHKDLEPNRLLPYIANEPLSSGGFSAVFKVKIHSWYYNWNASTPGSRGYSTALNYACLTDDVGKNTSGKKSPQAHQPKHKGRSQTCYSYFGLFKMTISFNC